MTEKLTEEQNSFFMDMEAMFDTSGWNHLVQGWHAEVRALPEAAFYNAKSIEELAVYRVRLQLLRELLDLPEELRRQKEELLSEQAPDV